MSRKNREKRIQKSQSSEHKNSSRKAPLLWCIVISIAVLVAFFPALSADFVYDDSAYITQNGVIKSLAWSNIASMLTETHFGNYQPVMLLGLAGQYALLGDSPSGFHFTSLLLHILVSLSVFFFARRLIQNDTAAGFVALLFAIHPLHVEPVAWISSQKDLWSGLFTILALNRYLAYIENRETRLLIHTLLLGSLAMLAKPVAAVVPLLLFLLDWHKERKNTFIHLLLEKLPLFCGAIVITIISASAQYALSGTHTDPIRMPESMLFPAYNFFFYIFKFFLPIGLSAHYPFPDGSGFNYPAEYLVAPFALLLVLSTLWFIRNKKEVVIPVLFFGITLAPASQISMVGNAISADRFAYLPILGLILLAAILIKKINSKPAIIFTYCLLVPLSILSHFQTQKWKDNKTLFADVLKKQDNSSLALINTADLLKNSGDLEAAEEIYISLTNKNDSGAYSGLATIAYLRGNDLTTIEPLIQRALQISPKDAIINNNYAAMLIQTGRHSQALAYLEIALQEWPFYAEAHRNLGIVWAKRNDKDKSLLHMIKAAQYGDKISQEFLSKIKVVW